ncbi:hypothetical protein BCR33DRAFT_719485 [Rhizoclosmatium globosum]|uniref:Uncharacterized protein n=1 Tax=Rhizoclosmatium globosum TaxID=329046 RepID=A0A1Y2C0J4_9FUNG|nr:hypothetical protein BCR33DRAFT_719485 [Rhizoclosmatium globosum]|eukprot:ORY40531.1 hypothetical protein BCR33DRAFT_719485 [Rhizoclosmatium globosum]
MSQEQHLIKACLGPGETVATCQNQLCLRQPCADLNTTCQYVQAPSPWCDNWKHNDTDDHDNDGHGGGGGQDGRHDGAFKLRQGGTVAVPSSTQEVPVPPSSTIIATTTITNITNPDTPSTASPPRQVPAPAQSNPSIFSSVNATAAFSVVGTVLVIAVMGIALVAVRRRFTSKPTTSSPTTTSPTEKSLAQESEFHTTTDPQQLFYTHQRQPRIGGFNIDDFFDDASSPGGGRDSASVLATPHYMVGMPPLERLEAPRLGVHGILELEAALEKLNQADDVGGFMEGEEWEEESVNTGMGSADSRRSSSRGLIRRGSFFQRE